MPRQSVKFYERALYLNVASIMGFVAALRHDIILQSFSF